MPVAVVMDFEGATLEQYDQICSSMGLTPRGAAPPGALFHWVTTAPTMSFHDVHNYFK